MYFDYHRANDTFLSITHVFLKEVCINKYFYRLKTITRKALRLLQAKF